MVEELCNGACIVMEIVHDENVPTTFREFVGPADPVSWALLENKYVFLFDTFLYFNMKIIV